MNRRSFLMGLATLPALLLPALRSHERTGWFLPLAADLAGEANISLVKACELIGTVRRENDIVVKMLGYPAGLDYFHARVREALIQAKDQGIL